MIIKSTPRNALYSTDPTASNVGRFLVRRGAMTTRERNEPVISTPALSLEELYPSLFEEPRLLTLLSRAAAAALDVLTGVTGSLRRRVHRQHAARARSARRLS